MQTVPLNTSRFAEWTLQKKILSLMVLVMAILIATTLFIVNFLATRAMNNKLNNDLNKTQILFKSYQAIRIKEISAENRLISEIPFLKALISTKDRESILDFASSFQERIGSDLFLITDDRGEILASTDLQKSTGSMKDESAIQNALSGKEGSGIIAVSDTLYQISTIPLGVGSSILGTITIGFRIDNRLAEEMKRITQSEISFIIGERLVASTWKDEDKKKIEDSLKDDLKDKIRLMIDKQSASLPFDLNMGQAGYPSILVPLTADQLGGAYLIQRSRYEETQFLNSIRLSVCIVGLLILISASWVSYILAKQISGPITQFTKAMANGDLSMSFSIRHNDEVGILAKAFNEMAIKLRNLILQVREATVAVAQVSEKLLHNSHAISEEALQQKKAVEDTSSSVMRMGVSITAVNSNVESLSVSAQQASSSILEMDASMKEIAGNMDHLSSSIEITSSSISEMSHSMKEITENIGKLQNTTEKTAASLHELNDSVQGVGENAQKSHLLSGKTSQDAQKGMEAVYHTITGMKEIKIEFLELKETISRLSQKSESIGKIVMVIAEVAEQTNLLSLNATIIAAQAGEEGRGFAVVADEIKDLAERTATSTREIATLIKEVQDETSNAVKAMLSGSEKVERGVSLSNQAGDVLKVILDSSDLSTGMVSEIVKVTREQAIGIQETDKAMLQVKQMVEQINRTIQEQEKASLRITRAVEDMRTLGQQVKNSTQEQRKGSKLITAAMEKVMVMIRQILSATQEQTSGSEQINRAVLIFKEGTEEGAHRAVEMNSVVITLSARSKQLEEEISRFRI